MTLETASKRILIVDDEESIRQLCVRTLSPFGHAVETAENAEQAMACFEKHRFDLLISDYRMPGALDGLALSREIKRRFPQTQIILMTGYPTLENAVSALRLGAADYLVKPFEQSELVDSVNRRHMTLGEMSVASEAASLAQPLPAAGPSPFSGQPIAKILLVDGSRTILALFKDLFKKLGFEVLTAKDGANGLAEALEQKPDLVILDGPLPTLDGFEVCRRLRADARMKSAKILMFTAGSAEEECRLAVRAGADGFISKSSNPAEIMSAVCRLFPATKAGTRKGENTSSQ